MKADPTRDEVLDWAEENWGVLKAIVAELNYQELKWGREHDREHSVPAWLLIIRKELEEAEEAWVSNEGDAGAIDEIRQVAATALNCLFRKGVLMRLFNDFERYENNDQE